MVKLNIDLPEHFLDEEVRDGYTVSSEMKKVWAVELDLLNEFMRVCHKHDIKFFASGGTILGAVRHKGFIPWDDDIDLMMMRSEYKRLCKIAQSEFKPPYFFQTEGTDPGSYRGHAQLRNSMTTAILKHEFHQRRKINQGIFIDIFPLDYVPNDFLVRKDLLSRMRWYSRKCHEAQIKSYPWHFTFRRNVIALFINSIEHFFESRGKAAIKAKKYFLEREKIAVSTKPSNHLLLTPFTVERWIYNVDDIRSSVDMPFEMLTIPVPVNYESVLNKTYGKWKEFVVGGSVHGGVIFDTEKPYTYYLYNNQESF